MGDKFKGVFMALAALVAGAGLTAVAAPAQAGVFAPHSIAFAAPDGAVSAAAVATCPTGYICLFEHTGYKGDARLFDRSQAGLRANGFNDKTSAACNTTGVRYRLFQHELYEGYYMWMEPGWCYSDLRYIQMGPREGVSWNDQASALGR